MALHLCRATESLWSLALSSAETEVILWPSSFGICTADSLIGPKVSQVIIWNTYGHDNAAYLACFLDAAFSALILLLGALQCLVVTANHAFQWNF